jgi:hypothetical protein
MANGTWKRSTSASRRSERQLRYAHVSVKVGVRKDPETGLMTGVRTPIGSGSTYGTPLKAQRLTAHDWLGAYPGKLASVERLQRERRNAKINQAYAARRAEYFASIKLEGELHV